MATTLVRIQLLSKTSTDFATANPVLLDGELGVANAGSAVPVMKIGDGVRPWTALPDIVAAGAGADYVAGPVNTLPPGSPATVVIDNTISPPTISFGIPAGSQGEEGQVGPANSLAIGTVTTLPPGSPASATITGTPPTQTLNLGLPSGLPGSMALADPTGLIGLAAVPGVSLLGTRSDATHALSQAIAPTWSAMHTFTATGSGSAAILIRSAVPSIVFEETDATATNKVFRLRTQGNNFLGEIMDDVFTGGTPVAWMRVIRAAQVVTAIDLTATTMTLAGTTLNLNQTTIMSLSTALHISNTNGPIIVLNDSDAAVDTKRWRIRNLSGAFQIITENDAGTAVATAILIGRVGTAVESITLTATAIALAGAATINTLRVGAQAPLSLPLLSVVNPASGNSIEWGHANVAGYRSTIGHTFTSGHAFIAFHAEHGTNANTYRTRGIAGSIIESNAAGALTFARATNVAADNQAPTVDLVWGANGQWGFTAPVNIGTTTTAQVLAMFGPAGSAKHIYFYSGAASRWIIRSNAIAESGSNAGSNFEILGVDDPAAVATAHLTINRASGAVSIPGTITTLTTVIAPAYNMNSTQPTIRWNETDAPLDEKLWDTITSNGDMFFRTRGDADGAGVTWMQVTRTGTAVDSVSFPQQTTFTRNSTIVNGDGAVAIVCALPALSWRSPAQAADNRAWAAWVDTLTWKCGTLNDANTTSAAWVAVLRAANTIANISFGNATNNPTFNFLGSGLVNIAGALTVAGVITGNSVTQALGNNTTAIATTAFVQAALPSSAARVWTALVVGSGDVQTNLTGRDLHVMVRAGVSSGGIVNVYSGAMVIGSVALSGSASSEGTVSATIPPGGTWQVVWSGAVSFVSIIGLV